MKPVPLIVGILTCLGLAFLLGEGLVGLVTFGIMGLLAGLYAGSLRPGSERVYWMALFATIVLLFIPTLGVSLDGFVVLLPIVLAVGYFVARVAGGMTGQLGAAPSE